MGFAIGAYRAVEHLGGAGSGRRVSPFWRAEDTRTLEDVALTVLPAEAAEPVRAVVEAVGGIRHPHLLPVADVVEDRTRVALVSPWPRGGRLTELVRRRGVLSVGEAVTVLLPVAAALAELHREHVRHGWVCPEAIWFDARGRPLLGATAVSLAVADVAGPAALGSADVAPEVFRQARSGPPGTAADVFSLGSVARFAITGQSAWPADEPADVLIQSAAGQWPDLPDDIGAPPLVALVRSMLLADPAARPTADAVVRRLSSGDLGDPAPIRFGAGPCPTPASSKRWRGWAGRAGADPGDGPEGLPVEDPADGVAGRGPEGPAGDHAEPAAASARPDPARARRGPMARLLVALLSGLLLTVLVAQVSRWAADPPSASVGEAGVTDWTQVVTDLDLARSRALAEADPVLLDEVYLPGSAAAAADAAVVAGLADQGLRVVDGQHDIVSVEVLAPDGTDGTRLAVTDTLAARPVVDGSGEQVAATVARGEQRRVLVLATTDLGFRISAIEPG